MMPQVSHCYLIPTVDPNQISSFWISLWTDGYQLKQEKRLNIKYQPGK